MEAQGYKCPCCGAALPFDSESGQLRCSSCGNSFDPETVKSFAEDISASSGDEKSDWESYTASSGSGDWSDSERGSLRLYTCSSCGGELLTDANTAATNCPYCGNNVIISDRLSGVLRPDYVVPFKLSASDAEAKLKNFYRGKPLLPSLFKTQNHIESIKALYVPFWLFDCSADATASYRATRVRTWNDSKYTNTETQHYLVTRAGTASFERVPVDGSVKMDNAYSEAIEPYDMSCAVDFSTAYLAGYLADRYDVDADAARQRADERIRQSAAEMLASTVSGYSSVTTELMRVNIKNGHVRYALLPVWMLNTTYKGKNYMFAMNGQTGVFAGKLPCSGGRIAAWLGGITGVLGLLFTLIWRFFIY